MEKPKGKGKMSEKERWDALINRQPVDRISFFPVGAPSFSCLNVGYSILDSYTNMAKTSEAQRKIADQYGYFPFVYLAYGAYGAWEFGGEIKMPASEYVMAPTVVRYPVGSEEDVLKLELPDSKTAGIIPLNMELSKLQEELPGAPIVPPVAHTVLTLAANLSGIESLCRWMMKKPELVHHLAQLAGEHIVEVAKYWVNTFGPERIIFYSAAATESNQMISPKQFEEFFLPYQKRTNEKLLAMGIKHLFVHICGDHNLNLPLWSQIPMGDPGILSFGHEVDLETAAKYFPSDIIVGNVNPTIIHTGSGDAVYELSRICIEKGKKAPGGFMLAAGCTISPLTPSYNYWVMQKSLEDFGWYD